MINPNTGSLPQLHELDLLELSCGEKVRIINDGASKWENIATRLYFDGGMINQISRDSGNVQQACWNVFSKWLSGIDGLREPRTWNTVVKALKEADLGQLAEKLETALTENVSCK